MNSKISIIIPVYNVENYLKRCVDSILNQTYKNLELILVNDGSLDSSGNICDIYEEEDSRVKVFHQSNKGQSAARNVGLKHAQGDFITFVDSDDWIELDMYEIMLNYSHKHKLDIIECEFKYTSKIFLEYLNKNNIAHKSIQLNPEFKIEDKKQAALRILENRSFSVCTKIYKSNLIKNMKFKENYIYEDMLFTSELLCKIAQVGYYNKPMYNYYNDNANSTMHGTYSAKNLDSIEVISKFKEYIENCFSNKNIIKASKKHILFFALRHYHNLFLHKNLDKNLIYRKQLKVLIKENYTRENKNNTFTKLARYCPIWGFDFFLRLYRLRNENV